MFAYVYVKGAHIVGRVYTCVYIYIYIFVRIFIKLTRNHLFALRLDAVQFRPESVAEVSLDCNCIEVKHAQMNTPNPSTIEYFAKTNQSSKKLLTTKTSIRET